jgi:hypothetical protein
VVVVIVVDDVGIEVLEVVEGYEEEEVITVGVAGVGLLDVIYCRNARGAVGGGTPVPRARGGGVEAEGGWR